MRINRSGPIFLTIIAGILASAFVFGQIFYYDQKTKNLLSQTRTPPTNIPFSNIYNALQQKFALKSEDKNFIIEPAELKNWVETYTRAYTGESLSRINAERVEVYLEKISETLNIPATNPKFAILEGKVSELEPARIGRKLNIPASTQNIISSLMSVKNDKTTANSASLVFENVPPAVTLDKVPELGVVTLLAKGESDFTGSSKSRINNISVGSKRFTGILIEPGEQFSFNKLLGEIDASAGYLPELVIKSGDLVPEYGGGLCQVSTTLFRAIAAAGLPIIERRPHSLPVRYYNPQGFDATIYPGVSDFRFLNDTPFYLLLQSRIVGSKIYFEIYGQDDGRKVELDGPHQYDVRSDGSLKAELLRIVTYPDSTKKRDLFQSSYKAPGSVPVRNLLE